MLCSDIMHAAKNTIPYPAPDTSEPRKPHPICSVLFESHDNYTESWLIHLNDTVIMGHPRHLPVDDVITTKYSIDVFLRYWCPGYHDSCGIGRQRCNRRSNWRNCKSVKLITTLYYWRLNFQSVNTRELSFYNWLELKEKKCAVPLQIVLSQLCTLYQAFTRVTCKSVEKKSRCNWQPTWCKEAASIKTHSYLKVVLNDQGK